MNRIAIDRAVLERAEGVCVIQAPFNWDDVGSWLAVPRLSGQDDQGNTTAGLVRSVDTKNCIIRTTDDHLVAASGMEDCIIVHTKDATLVRKLTPRRCRTNWGNPRAAEKAGRSGVSLKLPIPRNLTGHVCLPDEIQPAMISAFDCLQGPALWLESSTDGGKEYDG